MTHLASRSQPTLRAPAGGGARRGAGGAALDGAVGAPAAPRNDDDLIEDATRLANAERSFRDATPLQPGGREGLFDLAKARLNGLTGVLLRPVAPCWEVPPSSPHRQLSSFTPARLEGADATGVDSAHLLCVRAPRRRWIGHASSGCLLRRPILNRLLRFVIRTGNALRRMRRGTRALYRRWSAPVLGVPSRPPMQRLPGS